MSRGVLWFILATVIAACIYALSLLTERVSEGDAGLGIFALMIAAALLATFNELFISDRYREAKELSKKKRHASVVTDGFRQFVARIAVETIKATVPSDEEIRALPEPLERTLPRWMLSGAGFDEDEVDGLVALWLAYQWEELKKDPMADESKAFQTLDTTIRSTYPDIRYGVRTAKLMLAYKRIRGSWMANPRRADASRLFEGRLPQKEYKSLLFDFMKKTGQQHIYQALQVSESERLRATLIQLIADGRLSSYGLKKDTLERMQRELSRHGAASSLFLVFKNRFKELDEHLMRMPHIKGKAVRAKGFSGVEDSLMFQILIKTPRNYRSAEEFVDAEIRPRITSNNGFVAVVPLDQAESAVFPGPKDFAEKDIVKSNYELVNLLLTGYERQDIDLWMLLAKYEVPVEEVLSILPLTMMTGKLPPTCARSIWGMLDEIRTDFRIRTVTDWARVEPSEMTEYLFDKTPSLTFEEVSPDALEKACADAISEARMVAESLEPTQMEIV